ncbi:MAG TPA: SRPBCC domain-containing protein [Polyangia bacterium]
MTLIAGSESHFTTRFTVSQSPEAVFAAITDPRRWWSAAIEGDAGRLGGEWRYRYKDVHRATFRTTELVPGKKVVWHVADNTFNFVKDAKEWTGNDLVFEVQRIGDQTEVRFTQVGLVPAYECYEVCSQAWGSYVTGSLRNLITKGEGQPNPIEEIVARADEMRGTIEDASYTTAFTVDRSAAEVFAAINDVRAWWSGEIEGRTDEPGAEFTYRYDDLHRTTQAITELVPGKKVVWHVVDNTFNFVKDAKEWTGNDLVFEIERIGDETEVRFTQVGLVPAYEFYEVCSQAWRSYVTGSLRNLITKGEGQPNPIEEIVARADEMRGAIEDASYTTSFTVDRSAAEVFAAINDVRAWWSGEIQGRTDEPGAEFTYRYDDLHRTTQSITELVPGKKVVWHVVASDLSFVADNREWHDTDIVFEIAPKGRRTEVRFTHRGLRPALECYTACSAAWGHYINDALFRWISTGKPTATSPTKPAKAAREPATTTTTTTAR